MVEISPAGLASSSSFRAKGPAACNMKAKTREVRWMERKADLFPNASTKGRQWTPCHKDCLLFLNTAIRFYRPVRRGRTKEGEAGQATPGKRHAKTPPKSHSRSQQNI